MKNKDLSILLGICVGIFLYKMMIEPKRGLYHGPNSNTFRKNIYRIGNKCYRYEPKISLCIYPKKRVKDTNE